MQTPICAIPRTVLVAVVAALNSLRQAATADRRQLPRMLLLPVFSPPLGLLFSHLSRVCHRSRRSTFTKAAIIDINTDYGLGPGVGVGVSSENVAKRSSSMRRHRNDRPVLLPALKVRQSILALYVRVVGCGDVCVCVSRVGQRLRLPRMPTPATHQISCETLPKMQRSRSFPFLYQPPVLLIWTVSSHVCNWCGLPRFGRYDGDDRLAKLHDAPWIQAKHR